MKLNYDLVEETKKKLSELNKGPIKTKNIAEELGCTIRTVQRRLNELLLNFPIEQDKKNGTWSFIEGFSLEKQKLTNKETALLILIDRYIKSINNNLNIIELLVYNPKIKIYNLLIEGKEINIGLIYKLL